MTVSLADSPSISCVIGTGNPHQVQNKSLLEVKWGETVRMELRANPIHFESITTDSTSLPASFKEFFNKSGDTMLIHIHYLTITDSGTVAVHGFDKLTHNTNYLLIIKFRGTQLVRV